MDRWIDLLKIALICFPVEIIVARGGLSGGEMLTGRTAILHRSRKSSHERVEWLSTTFPWNCVQIHWRGSSCYSDISIWRTAVVWRATDRQTERQL